LVEKYVKSIEPRVIWDLGANDGTFSRIGAENGGFVVSFDIDPSAVEKNYLRNKKDNEKGILPLVMDLTNPSSSIGWANSERDSLIERGGADLVLFLALIHHIAISNNVPFDKISKFLAEITRYLIIEFVPKEDSQVQKLLSTREDIFDGYEIESFKKSFSVEFEILSEQRLEESYRTLFFMKNRRLGNSVL